MKSQTHILNGDALREQFPKAIQGEIIVARECLVDGNLEGVSLADFFTTRAQFLSKNYGGSEKEYYTKVVSEFEKIQRIPKDSTIYLWFEDDLFCQVNFWFVAHLIESSNRAYEVYLVRPKAYSPYSFGRLNRTELIEVYEQKVALLELPTIASLWRSYRTNDLETLESIAQTLASKHPFILPAVQAHIQLTPTKGHVDRPTQTLLTIMETLQTKDFGSVFQEFCKREAIYGFGDLQVKRIFNRLLHKQSD